MVFAVCLHPLMSSARRHSSTNKRSLEQLKRTSHSVMLIPTSHNHNAKVFVENRNKLSNNSLSLFSALWILPPLLVNSWCLPGFSEQIFTVEEGQHVFLEFNGQHKHMGCGQRGQIDTHKLDTKINQSSWLIHLACLTTPQKTNNML